MKNTIELLRANSGVSDWKINITEKTSYELFFVKGALETVRHTDTCDKSVTVYADHDAFKGDSEFPIYPSTTEAEIAQNIADAVAKALLINNKHFELPAAETGEYAVESNFPDYAPEDLAAIIANAVFESNKIENASLNSVEIFINKYTETVINSRGLEKKQTRYDAMVEAIPTYNGESQSVELYEQYNFSSLDIAALTGEIERKMQEVKARYEAKTPESPIACPVILGSEELMQLMFNLARQMNYATVYSHSNLYNVGDDIQREPTGDKLTVTMQGGVKGSTRSSCFDSDGLSLGEKLIIEEGKALSLYGSNRFGQYLGEAPTGALGCLCLTPGSATDADFAGESLELISMSGLQVDLFSDYIGGEIRLAYYRDAAGGVTPLTGISVSGKLSEVLSNIRLSEKTTVLGGYSGPEKAIVNSMKIF